MIKKTPIKIVHAGEIKDRAADMCALIPRDWPVNTPDNMIRQLNFAYPDGKPAFDTTRTFYALHNDEAFNQTNSGKLIGRASFYVIQKKADTVIDLPENSEFIGTIPMLHSVIVDEQSREKGVAKKLVETACLFLKAKGFKQAFFWQEVKEGEQPNLGVYLGAATADKTPDGKEILYNYDAEEIAEHPDKEDKKIRIFRLDVERYLENFKNAPQQHQYFLSSQVQTSIQAAARDLA